MRIGRENVIDSRALLDGLADGKKPRVIAAEVGCAYSTLRRRLSRHVHSQGLQTVEQAVAVRVAENIKAALPLALQSQVDIVLRRK